MKFLAKVLLSSMFALYAVAAYATCTTSTVTYDGRMVTCTTCCYNGNCNTTCF